MSLGSVNLRKLRKEKKRNRTCLNEKSNRGMGERKKGWESLTRTKS